MGNITLIFTPPNHPELQPIELLWAQTKSKVRNWFRWGRNQDDLMEQARIAWYGNDVRGPNQEHCDGKDGISVVDIQNLIRHSFKEATKWCQALNLGVDDIKDLYKEGDEEPPALPTSIVTDDHIPMLDTAGQPDYGIDDNEDGD